METHSRNKEPDDAVKAEEGFALAFSRAVKKKLRLSRDDVSKKCDVAEAMYLLDRIFFAVSG